MSESTQPRDGGIPPDSAYSEEARRRLGHRLQSERGGRTRREIATESGVSLRSVSDYEIGRAALSRTYAFPRKLLQLVAFYGWTVADLERVLEGGEADAESGRRPLDVGHLRRLGRLYLDPAERQLFERSILPKLVEADATHRADPRPPKGGMERDER